MPSVTSKPIILTVVMLTVVMLTVIMLTVVMLNVVMLNVAEPIFSLEKLEFRVFKLLQKLQSNRLIY